MATFHLNLLGTFQAKLDGVEITASIPGKLRALLAYLATQPGTVFHRDTLAGFFWSDQPAEKALHSLQHLARKKKAYMDRLDDKLRHGRSS